MASPVSAADVSTYSFNSGMNCNAAYPLPDTGQSASYTATFGEDHDYAPAGSQMSYTMYSVGTASYTVDNRTGLVWVTNPSDVCAGCAGGYVSSGTYAWENALTACEGLIYAGFSDWRLPNVRELMSIVDYGVTSDPRINTAYFLNTASYYYWTSTTYALASTGGWYVYFIAGRVDYANKSNNFYVRCVRGGPYPEI